MINKDELIVVMGDSDETTAGNIAVQLRDLGFKFSSGKGCWNGVQETAHFVRVPVDFLELSRVINVAAANNQEAVCVITHRGYGFTHMLNDVWESTIAPPVGDHETAMFLEFFNGPMGRLHMLPKVQALKEKNWFALNGSYFMLGEPSTGVVNANTAVSSK